jgi:glycosyltransferase involved in cell wall biosynthesis
MENNKLMKKIAFLSVFHPYRGGIAQSSGSLYFALQEKANVEAINFKRQYPDILFPGKSQFVPDGDDREAIDGVRILDSVNPLNWLNTAKYINNLNPDVVLTRYWIPFLAPALGTVLKKTKKNAINISIVDNAIPHEKRIGDDALTNYYLKQNHKFIALSKSVERDLYTLLDSPEVHYHPHPVYDRFPDPIDKSKAREKLGINADEKIILFFGFIRDYKGLDILLHSMNDVDNDVKLLIAGDVYGSYDKYEKIIKDNNLSDRIISKIDYIPDEDVALYFSATDLCVQPYRTATQSGIANISTHYNIPIIATDVGGLKEVIEPFNIGKVVEKADPKEIAEKINAFFREEKDYSENFKSYKEFASWEKLSDVILEAIEK